MNSNDEPVELDLLAGYRAWSQVYDSEYNPLIAVEKREVERILRGLSFADVLDAGCGTGRWTLRLAQFGASVVGLDQSPEMLQVAEAKARAQGVAVRFDTGSLEGRLPYNDQSFDLVISALVLDHLDDLPAVVREFARVLRPGGHVLVTDFHPDMVAAGGRSQFVSGGTTYYLPNPDHSRGDYLAAVEGAGLETIEVLDIDASSLPAVVREAVPLFAAGALCLVILARKR